MLENNPLLIKLFAYLIIYSNFAGPKWGLVSMKIKKD